MGDGIKFVFASDVAFDMKGRVAVVIEIKHDIVALSERSKIELFDQRFAEHDPYVTAFVFRAVRYVKLQRFLSAGDETGIGIYRDFGHVRRIGAIARDIQQITLIVRFKIAHLSLAEHDGGRFSLFLRIFHKDVVEVIGRARVGRREAVKLQRHILERGEIVDIRKLFVFYFIHAFAPGFRRQDVSHHLRFQHVPARSDAQRKIAGLAFVRGIIKIEHHPFRLGKIRVFRRDFRGIHNQRGTAVRIGIALAAGFQLCRADAVLHVPAVGIYRIFPEIVLLHDPAEFRVLLEIEQRTIPLGQRERFARLPRRAPRRQHRLKSQHQYAENFSRTLHSVTSRARSTILSIKTVLATSDFEPKWNAIYRTSP